MNETAKSLLFCVIFFVSVCAVTVGLLVLGAWMGEEVTAEKKEKVITCEQGSKGFYKCKAEFI